jgi:NAD(P)-dependent dehydrogenase (short-subunit alcohol dehydrogenase family)
VILSLGPHRAVVVGAAGAIGAAICSAYAAAGARVVALDLEGEASRQMVAALGGEHTSGILDVTDSDAVNREAELIYAGGPVDSIVYAAGVEFTADLIHIDWTAYRALMAVNLDGAFYVAQAFGTQMLAAGRGGSFAFLSSTAGKRGEAGAGAYCASKFGLLGLVESFAAEVATSGVRVNAVCPGNVESPMLESVARSIAQREGLTVGQVLDRFAGQAAAGRLVQPDEVAAVVVWLASSLASAVTGEAIDVDAGALYP